MLTDWEVEAREVLEEKKELKARNVHKWRMEGEVKVQREEQDDNGNCDVWHWHCNDSFPIRNRPKKRGQVQGRVSRQGGVTANLLSRN